MNKIETFQHEVFLNEDYTPRMLEDFYQYWSEPNKSGTKMKWELEKTWDLKRRLRRWFDNQNKWNNGNSKATGAHQLLEELRADWNAHQR